MNVAQQIKQHKVGRPRDILFIQLYSMRSYQDNTYNPLSDGNFNHTLHELYNLLHVYKVSVNLVTITIPNNVLVEAYMKVTRILNYIFRGTGATYNIIPLKYGTNVAGTRMLAPQIFSKYMHDKALSKMYDDVVCDFELVQFDDKNLNIIYRFNVIPDIDSMRNAQLYVVNANYPVSVFNEWQLEFYQKELRTIGNAFMSTKWFNRDLVYAIAELCETIPTVKDSNPFLFIPFRLSDASYHIDECIREWKKEFGDMPIVVTDPNDSADEHLKNDKVILMPMDKIHLYKFCMANESKMHIKYKCNPIVTLHQSFLEFMVLCPEAVECPTVWKEYTFETYIIDETNGNDNI